MTPAPAKKLSEREIEIRRRHRLGMSYFEVGQLYKLNTEYIGIVKELEAFEDGKRTRTIVPKGSVVLCTKNDEVVYPNGTVMPYAIIEFLFVEIVLHYVSDAWQLCEVMDPMLPEQKEEEESYE